MKVLLVFISFNLSLFVISQEEKDYIGSWYSPGIYTQAIFKLNKDKSVDWIGSGCTYRNETRNGSWSYEGDHIVILMFKDTIKVTRIDRKLVSYPLDLNDSIDNKGFKKTVWSSKFGLKLLRNRQGRLRNRRLRREDRNL